MPGRVGLHGLICHWTWDARGNVASATAPASGWPFPTMNNGLKDLSERMRSLTLLGGIRGDTALALCRGLFCCLICCFLGHTVRAEALPC